MSMITRKTWGEFKTSGLLWFVNRALHVFGWAIVLVFDADGSVSDAYPARVKFRGFDESTETNGFTQLTRYMENNAEDLMADINEG